MSPSGLCGQTPPEAATCRYSRDIRGMDLAGSGGRNDQDLAGVRYCDSAAEPRRSRRSKDRPLHPLPGYVPQHRIRRTRCQSETRSCATQSRIYAGIGDVVAVIKAAPLRSAAPGTARCGLRPWGADPPRADRACGHRSTDRMDSSAALSSRPSSEPPSRPVRVTQTATTARRRQRRKRQLACYLPPTLIIAIQRLEKWE